ncbi:MAG: hypothetical protein AB8F78_17260 [Saprospiraceae bacterium]
MSKSTRQIFLSISAGLILTAMSCVKDVNSVRYAIEPAINLVSLSGTELTEFTDTLFVRFRYEDGDGDLGGLEGLSRLYVLDQRLSEPDIFALEMLTPDGEALSIAGDLNVALGPYFKLGNSPEEVFNVELWIIDRAGNESNHITTEELTIR